MFFLDFKGIKNLNLEQENQSEQSVSLSDQNSTAMLFEKHPDNPFQVQISFHKLIENLEQIALSDVSYRAEYAKALLQKAAMVPELRNGITDLELVNTHKEIIRFLMADLFPTALTKNEIKAVTIPFHNITFNYSERFQHILNNAGPDFDMNIRDFNDDEFYIMSCCLILNAYFGYKLDFSMPFFYDIPDEDGVMRHYRILYNADFIEVLPTEKAIVLTSEEVELLIDNYHDAALWKSKFPPQSWIMRGFGIMTLYDATTESAVSNLKTNLLSKPEGDVSIAENFQNIFRSIFHSADLRIGFTSLNLNENKFVVSAFDKKVHSFILGANEECDCSDLTCNDYFKELIDERKYFTISDVKKFAKETEETEFAEHLLAQNIKSAIFAPLIKNDKLLGIIEVVSSKNKELNSINANKMDIVIPYLTDTIDRYYSDVQNKIDALIQNEYTTIHPSVYWKFRQEALEHINDTKEIVLHEIVFPEVFPLYGQIDIKGSSDMRNATTKEDIIIQVNLLAVIFESILKEKKLPLFEQKVFELHELAANIQTQLNADTEQLVLDYIKAEINPILKSYQSENEATTAQITAYFSKLDAASGTIYESRKKFDTTLSIINKKMAAILDKKQAEAQSFYPHYYERFKTDGVEHNLYIGNSITNQPDFDKLYLYNLRLWQLQVMCDMENQYHALKSTLPYQMEVTSLLLVFNNPITIRFRMDEKRFDVDGSYNARYEVVKKRIDKANIKGTSERITKKDTITIVYSQQNEENEYRRYIRFLQHKGLLGSTIENFDIEDLQGVSGLKGLRVDVLFSKPEDAKVYTYQELLEEIRN